MSRATSQDDIQPQPAGTHVEEYYGDKKEGEATAVVIPYDDVEGGEGVTTSYEVPKGVEARYVREEKVVRGLAQRHIQVSQTNMSLTYC